MSASPEVGVVTTGQLRRIQSSPVHQVPLIHARARKIPFWPQGLWPVLAESCGTEHDRAALATAAANAPGAEDLGALFSQLPGQGPGESAFLSIRRGDETVCLMREEGSFPLRSFVLHEGVRFPLGVASAGLAIMVYLPEDELEERLVQDEAFVERWGEKHSAAANRSNLEQEHKVGYSVNPGLILEDSWGMGAAIFDRSASQPGRCP